MWFLRYAPSFPSPAYFDRILALLLICYRRLIYHMVMAQVEGGALMINAWRSINNGTISGDGEHGIFLSLIPLFSSSILFFFSSLLAGRYFPSFAFKRTAFHKINQLLTTSIRNSTLPPEEGRRWRKHSHCKCTG